MKYRKPLQLFCFVLFAVFAVAAQESSEKKPEKLVLNETVKRDGLSQPIFANLPSKDIPKKSLTIQGIKVLTKYHKFDKRQFFSMVESCDLENDSISLGYNDFDYLLDGFTSYEMNGKVFAYQANFWFIEPENGKEIGAGILPIYVDEEGDGNFKLRCDEGTELKTLPDWIKSTQK